MSLNKYTLSEVEYLEVAKEASSNFLDEVNILSISFVGVKSRLSSTHFPDQDFQKLFSFPFLSSGDFLSLCDLHPLA